MTADSTPPISERKTRWRLFWTVLAFLLPALLVIVMVSNAVQQARQTSFRVYSKNNLKQLGLAMHNYHDSFSVLPPGSISGRPHQSHHSWMLFLLPGIESSPLYNAVDFNRPWNDLRNAYHFREQLPYFLNPAIEQTTDERGFGVTHYAANSQIFSENKSVSFKDLPQGTSQTVLAGEIADDFPPWGKPGNWRDPTLPPNSSAASFGRPSRDGAQMLMADGSIRFVANAVDQKIYQSPARTKRNPKYEIDIRHLEGDLRIMVQIDQDGKVIMASGPWHDKTDYREGKLGAKTIVTDATMKVFAGMPDLEHLSVSSPDLSDQGLRLVKDLQRLKLLQIRGGRITDDGLKSLENLKNLKVLSIGSSHITESGINRLKWSLPDCEINWSGANSNPTKPKTNTLLPAKERRFRGSRFRRERTRTWRGLRESVSEQVLE